MPKFLISMPCKGIKDSRRTWAEVLGASCGSPCRFDRAFIDPKTGNTTCVWEAPGKREVTALFKRAGVTVAEITRVEEMTEASSPSP